MNPKVLEHAMNNYERTREMIFEPLPYTPLCYQPLTHLYICCYNKATKNTKLEPKSGISSNAVPNKSTKKKRPSKYKKKKSKKSKK